MYSSERSKPNNAQRARDDKNYSDKNATKSKRRLGSGSEVDVTDWSDGSSTHHFGGPVGDVEFDENGEEC
jgi:hypothetical protein